MPSPRDIAKKVNNSGGFGDDSPGYDTVGGVPANLAQSGEERDYRANPSNPPEKSPPCKDMKR